MTCAMVNLGVEARKALDTKIIKCENAFNQFPSRQFSSVFYENYVNNRFIGLINLPFLRLVDFPRKLA